MSYRKIFWRPEDWERAVRMRRGGMSYRHIAETLHFSEDRVKVKFGNESARLRMTTGEPKRRSDPPNAALIERDRAISTAISLTASIMGDPLPGRSALDKRKHQRPNLAEPPRISAVVKVGLSR